MQGRHQYEEVPKGLRDVFTHSRYCQPNLLHRSPDKKQALLEFGTNALMRTNQVKEVAGRMHNSESLGYHTVT